MSAKVSGGSTGGQDSAGEQHGSDGNVLEHMPDAYRAYLFDYCYGLLRDPDAAADAVRETLIAAESQAGKLRDPDRLLAWLYSIARRDCLSKLPRGRRTASQAAPAAAQLPAVAAETSGYQALDPESEAREVETILVVTAALDGLSDRDRELLNLAFRHGFDDADLGAVIGVSAGRARRLVVRASGRFGKSAAVVEVMRSRWTRCEIWEKIVGDTDPDLPWLTPKLRKRLTRHINSCDTCTWSRGDVTFGPDLLSVVPLAVPPAAIWQPVTATASGTEHGSGRRAIAARLGSLGKDGFPVQPDARRALVGSEKRKK